MSAVFHPAFVDSLPDDVRQNAARSRAMALSADHAAHKQRLAAIDARCDAWSDRIDALCEEWEASNG